MSLTQIQINTLKSLFEPMTIDELDEVIDEKNEIKEEQP